MVGLGVFSFCFNKEFDGKVYFEEDVFILIFEIMSKNIIDDFFDIVFLEDMDFFKGENNDEEDVEIELEMMIKFLFVFSKDSSSDGGDSL